MSSPRLLAFRVAALSLALAAGATTASAQLGGLRKKATDAIAAKANQKVDQKIDEAAQKLVDHSFDSVFGDDKSGRTGAGSSGGGGGGGGGSAGGSSRIFSMLPNAPTEDHYDFDAVLTYEIENLPKGKAVDDNKGLVVMHFNSDGKYTGTRIASATPKKGDGEVFAIFDVKNESMVMLITSDTGKMSVAYSWKDAKRYAPEPASPSTPSTGSTATVTNAPAAKPMTFTSLGKRTIAGYSADGYKGENEDGEAEVWVSNDPKLSFSRLMGASSSMKGMRTVMPGSYPAGMLLEVTSTDHKSGDKGRMTVKSIDTKAHVHIDMNDYPRLGKAK